MDVILSRTVIEPIVILVITLFLCYLSKTIIKKVFSVKNSRINEKKQKTVSNLITNIVVAFIGIIGFILVLQSFGIDTASFVASLGVFSLVIGLALQDIIKDVFVGMSIIFEGQYNIGDWVKIGDFKGEVIASSLRTTKLKAYTGEIKIIANRQITEIVNYSMSKSTFIIDIGVSYDTDIDKARTVLNNLCAKSVNNKLKNMEYLGIQAMEDSSITLRLIGQVNYNELYSTERMIREEIIKAFRKENIEIPYPQVVIHDGKKISTK